MWNSRIALSLNLFYLALNYVSATFATALTNTNPAITFILALCFRYKFETTYNTSIIVPRWYNHMFFVRMESVSIKQKHGIAKVIGSALGLTGALLCTFARGPAMYPESQRDNILHLTKQNYTKGDWVKGSLIILAANVAWCSWLIMQVRCF